MDNLVWFKHPFGARIISMALAGHLFVSDSDIEKEIKDWIAEKYREGYRICATPLMEEWCFERIERDDGK